MQTEIVQYKGWNRCLRISNGIIDLLVTLDVGPRIIRLGFVGKDNEFCEFPDQVGQVGGSEWRSYGGHRLWHGPEVMPRTYYPDNTPVQFEDHKTFIRFISDVEKDNNVQKEIDVEVLDGQAQVRVTHRIRNTGLWPVELTPWAISVVATEGVAIVPLPPRTLHPGNYVPLNLISLWPVTDMSDERYIWGKKFILFKQSDSHPSPQKVGLSVPAGWAAYARKGHLFLKQVRYQPNAVYPDGGCNVELYNQEGMAELETLGPLSQIPTGEAVEHLEVWTLLDKVAQPASEVDVETSVLPAILPILSHKI
jgi:hypothetical protein